MIVCLYRHDIYYTCIYPKADTVIIVASSYIDRSGSTFHMVYVDAAFPTFIVVLVEQDKIKFYFHKL